MGSPISLLKGLGLGAGLMYLFDPRSGRRRRALIADQVTHLCNEMQDAVGVGARDLGHRMQGVAAETSAMFAHDGADDRVIEERVRAQLGRVASHPRAIRVEAHDGRITLSGPILAGEAARVLSAVARVRGVAGVEDRMAHHESPGDVPALQGGTRRTGERPELWQRNWSPATRLVLGVAGGVAMTRLLAGRGGLGLIALGLVGAGLAASGSAGWTTGQSGTARAMPRRGQSMTSASL